MGICSGVVGKGRTLSENYGVWRDSMMNLLYTIVKIWGDQIPKKATRFLERNSTTYTSIFKRRLK